MAEVIWPQRLVDLVLEMPDREREGIFRKIAHLETFPEMYPVRASGPFRGYRWFLAGSWLVYYRVVEGKVYLRAIWPARIP
ncbi:MAG: hypothetical protein HYS38_06185 [Acidobacteria bacterium]|nr:hypothetical protein [Acidobacteriota bacterium]